MTYWNMSFPEGNLGEVTWCKYNSEASSPHIPWDAARTKLATEVTLEGPGSGLPAGRRYSSEHHKRSVVWGVSHPIISNSPLCSWSVNMAKKKKKSPFPPRGTKNSLLLFLKINHNHHQTRPLIFKEMQSWEYRLSCNDKYWLGVTIWFYFWIFFF